MTPRASALGVFDSPAGVRLYYATTITQRGLGSILSIVGIKGTARDRTRTGIVSRLRWCAA
jgi:hypothetical protein